jgi:hypothetical protein
MLPYLQLAAGDHWVCEILLPKHGLPKTVLIDPKANPFFFVFTFLFLNGECWYYSILYNSAFDPNLAGLHSRSKRNDIRYVKDTTKATRHIPFIDLVARILIMILPAIVGA